MTSQTGYQKIIAIIIDVFPDIARSKDNQTMKFRKLVVYDIKYFHTQNEVEKLVSNPSLKNRN